jgi:hypothetical protein
VFVFSALGFAVVFQGGENYRPACLLGKKFGGGRFFEKKVASMANDVSRAGLNLRQWRLP